MKRLTLILRLSTAVASCGVFLIGPGEADAYHWSKATVDETGILGGYTSIYQGPGSTDLMISYALNAIDALRFAICDRSASTNGNCDQTGDWSKVTVDDTAAAGSFSSLTVNGNGDPMISYFFYTVNDLWFATCDRSASTNGNCDQPADWRMTAVDTAGDTG